MHTESPLTPSQIEEKIQNAIIALQLKEFKSIRKAAEYFEVPKSTLIARVAGRKSRTQSHEMAQILSNAEENTLVRWISRLTITGFPATPMLVKEMADEIRLRRVQVASSRIPTSTEILPIGHEWIYRFQKRHPELKTCYSRQLESNRAKEATPEKFRLGLTRFVRVSLNETGKALSPMVIFKAQNTNSAWIPKDTPQSWQFSTSTNGWTSNSHGLEWLKRVFEPESKKVSGDRPRLLIMDGHSSHITGSFIAFCIEKDIDLLILPPHCSHLLQPLDIAVYGPMKRYHALEVDRYSRAGVKRIQRAEWLAGEELVLVPFAPRKVLDSLPFNSSQQPSTPQMRTSNQDLDLSILRSSPPDGTELRQANQTFNKALADNDSLASPTRRYRCLKASEAARKTLEAIRRNNRAVQKACAPGTATNTVPADAQSTQSSANSTAPPSTARTFEIQVPATPREGGESAKRATDSPASQTRASKRAKAAPGQMNLKLLSRNSVRKARVEDAMDTDDDDIAASTQLTEDTNPFSNDPALHITVAWANVGKGAGAHSVLLQLAYENGADVVCVQEPWSSPGTKTQNHPAYECYAPYDSWEAEEATEREAERPRTMSYIRRGAAVQAQQRRGERNRDVVWLEVNGHHIVNIYREPNTMAMINYTVGIVPGPRTLIGGDFNAKHDTYEPGVLSATQGATLANWSQDTGMDFIGEVGVPTHRAGHVIDLTFSNIPFAETVVRRDMDCGSDHFTQVTTIPGRGTPPNKRVGYRVTEDGLYTFASLIESGAYWLPKVMNIASDAELETATEQLTDLFQRAIRTAGRPATDRARSAPWWDSESASAYSLYKRSGRTLEDRKRMLSATRKAKREYWRRLIDNASDDADLYKVVGWHKAAGAQVARVIARRTAQDCDQRTGCCREHHARSYLPHTTPRVQNGPHNGIDKETAAASFTDWWNALPPNTITIFSDGSESYDDMGKHVGYGYAIYQGQTLAATGKGAINTLSHVFDAEAIGALKGLQKALTLPSDADTERWLCIDSTSVIWCKTSERFGHFSMGVPRKPSINRSARGQHTVVPWAPGYNRQRGSG
ncbi:hypothetical protein DID88_001779 [Monilinia fructigena]|uniref:HTH CENPB-type domain-containing protein n=1 Tax=Monilinia fructigena TaxID=38457 RepID=A0A395IY91_9HELO|nr:hypothetical protein DID88_001779 [Monilinia fructigena]